MSKRAVELLLVAGAAWGAFAARDHLSGYARDFAHAHGWGRPAKAPQAAQAAPAAPAPPPAQLSAPQAAGFSAAETTAMQALYARFAVGDFLGALKLADDALVQDGLGDAYRAWLKEQLPVLLTSAGWARLKLGDCDEATTYLRRSEALRRTPETTKGLAVCYYKQKNWGAAREQFGAYLDKQPNDFQMQLLYTDLLESDGRYDEAVKLLEQLVAAPPSTDPAEPPRPDPEQLKQRLESMRGRLHESVGQQTETSRDFRLTYVAGDQEDLVAYTLQTLEDALDEYVQNYGFTAPQAQIEVILYPSGDFKSVVVGGPEWAEGLFDGRLRIPVRPEILASHNFDGLSVVLRHELVHALLSLMSDSRTIPPWFDEGLAQRLSCAGRPCGAFTFDAQPGGFLPAGSFQTSYIALSAVNAGRAYRQSLYLILTLERRYGDGALRTLVSRITTNSDLSSDGLLQPLGTTFKDLTALAGDYWTHRYIPR